VPWRPVCRSRTSSPSAFRYGKLAWGQGGETGEVGADNLLDGGPGGLPREQPTSGRDGVPETTRRAVFQRFEALPPSRPRCLHATAVLRLHPLVCLWLKAHAGVPSRVARAVLLWKPNHERSCQRRSTLPACLLACLPVGRSVCRHRWWRCRPYTRWSARAARRWLHRRSATLSPPWTRRSR